MLPIIIPANRGSSGKSQALIAYRGSAASIASLSINFFGSLSETANPQPAASTISLDVGRSLVITANPAAIYSNILVGSE